MNPDIPATASTIDSDTLVEQLRAENDDVAWRRVDKRYGPMLLAFAVRMGLDAERSRDARQEAMLSLVQALRDGQYDRQRGRLRDFLFAIARNRIIDIVRRRARESANGRIQSVEALDLATADDEWQAAWDAEWRIAVAAQALCEAQERFHADTYQVFHLKAIEGLSSVEVGERLNRSVNAVDVATSRVRRFLREIRPVIEERF